MKKTIYSEDIANNRMKVERTFDAGVKEVWQAWTDPVILDQWWAPLPWKAVTKSMDFREGGKWHYYMAGPEGEKHWCIINYFTINKLKQFTGEDAFADENGNLNTEMPNMKWEVSFLSTGDTTDVTVFITFKSQEDMKKIVEMGFKEGFSMAHENLDKVLQKQTA